jgi:3-phosphoshikimate 1-carboxyvinyltransferase
MPDQPLTVFPISSLAFIHRDSQGKIRPMKIRPGRRLKGRPSIPGDKSLSHRSAIIAALAEGISQISDFSTSRDCASTLLCLRELGVSIEQSGNSLRVEGVGKVGFRAPNEQLDCGNSGSTMRMLAGVLAGQNFSSTLIGDGSLRCRPMERIIEPLEMMGAHIESLGGKLPLRIAGTRPLRAIRYEMPVASAQVKSCVLLAGIQADGRTDVIETLGTTRDHTERMLAWFGVPVERVVTADASAAIGIHGPISFAARGVNIPGDISSAAFLIAAAALLPGSELEIEGVGLNSPRTQFLSTLRSVGLDVRITEIREKCNEPVGNIRVSGGSFPEPQRVESNSVRGSLIPQLIDELPLLAVVGTQISGGIEIRDAAELRFKETDRIATTVKNLRMMGVGVEEFEDGLAVAGPASLSGAELDSFGDHRIAMAFTIAAFLADGASEIAGAECVEISFPEFFELLESLVQR